jgi:hypothetical protein
MSGKRVEKFRKNRHIIPALTDARSRGEDLIHPIIGEAPKKIVKPGFLPG